MGILAPILNLYYTIIIHIINIFIITPARAENKKIKVIDFFKMKKERKEKKKVGGLLAFRKLLRNWEGMAERAASGSDELTSLPCARGGGFQFASKLKDERVVTEWG